jgi:hypothetical protein
MKKRLVFSAAFGALGLAIAIPLGDRLGIDTVVALVGCSAAGTALGYCVSMFLDVFLPGSTETD